MWKGCKFQLFTSILSSFNISVTKISWMWSLWFSKAEEILKHDKIRNSHICGSANEYKGKS